jgi:hypothetical protein
MGKELDLVVVFTNLGKVKKQRFKTFDFSQTIIWVICRLFS